MTEQERIEALEKKVERLQDFFAKHVHAGAGPYKGQLVGQPEYSPGSGLANKAIRRIDLD